MAAWVCVECTTTFSVGAPRCPHCGSTTYTEQGVEDMPKITVHGGPSVAGASVVGGSWSDEGDADVWPEPAEEQGEETPAETPAHAYEDWTVEQLKEELAARNLAKSGKRDDLVQRLRDDDAARAAAPETE
ncbi:SAP domain-containing protein [Streptomyces sp. NPDC102476]|jgi:hypothetical protein|uniref:SAP domain-containing protein n=1 Tax=Streptomyces sp. NPDC102476 TaxID=3366181 RepID=UPI0038075C8B